ncbi:MAG: YceI family protein [Candidatus Sulfotelmatobacter sp.]
MSTVGMPQTTVHYVIDGDKSTFTVRAFATGLLSSFGHNPTIAIPDFEGEILLDPESIEKSTMRLLIHSASLIVTDDIREKDRAEINRTMQEEVLESDSYPEIVYECSALAATKMGEGQYWGTMAGELTLHGVKRSQPIAIRISLSGDILRATGDFSVKQSDYKIRPVSAAAGTIKLKDELKFSFDISAHKDGLTGSES